MKELNQHGHRKQEKNGANEPNPATQKRMQRVLLRLLSNEELFRDLQDRTKRPHALGRLRREFRDLSTEEATLLSSAMIRSIGSEPSDNNPLLPSHRFVMTHALPAVLANRTNIKEAIATYKQAVEAQKPTSFKDERVDNLLQVGQYMAPYFSPRGEYGSGVDLADVVSSWSKLVVPSNGFTQNQREYMLNGLEQIRSRVPVLKVTESPLTRNLQRMIDE